MAKKWVENTSRVPKTIEGRLVQPGDGIFVEDVAATVAAAPIETRALLIEGNNAIGWKAKAGQDDLVKLQVDGLAPVSGDWKRLLTPLRMFGAYPQVQTNAAYQDRSYRVVINHPADFAACRVWFCNNDAGNTFSIGALKVSASDSFAAAGPTNGAWITGTQNNSTSLIARPCQVADEPQYLASNWMPVQSLARVDGGTQRLLYVDGYIPAGNASVTLMGNTSNPSGKLGSETTSNRYRGRIIADYSAAGNIVGASAGWSFGQGYGTPFFGVEFMGATEVLTVHVIADSIGQGDGDSDTPLNGGTVRACADLSALTGRPVVAANHGLSSQRTDGFVRRLRNLLQAGMLRGVVVYHPYSPNNRLGSGPFTPPMIEGMKATTLEAASLLQASGVSVVMRSSTPRTGFGAVEDALREGFDGWVRSLCADRGFIYADVAAVLSQGTGPKSYITGASDDGLHPNDAGYDLEAPVMSAAIRAAASWFFA